MNNDENMTNIEWAKVVGNKTLKDGGYAGELLELTMAHLNSIKGKLPAAQIGEIYATTISNAIGKSMEFAMTQQLREYETEEAKNRVALGDIEVAIAETDGYKESKLKILANEAAASESKAEQDNLEKLILREKLKTEQEKNGEMKYVHMYKWKYYDYDGNKISVVPSKNDEWIAKRDEVIAKEIEVAAASGAAKDTAMSELAVLEEQLRGINKYNVEPVGSESTVNKEVILQMYQDGKGKWVVYDSVASKKISIKEMYLSYGDVDTKLSARELPACRGASIIITDINGKVMIINEADESTVEQEGFNNVASISSTGGSIGEDTMQWNGWADLVTNAYANYKDDPVFAGVKNICEGYVFANDENINNKMIEVTTETSTAASGVTGSIQNVVYHVEVDESEIYASRLSNDGDVTGANQSVIRIEKQALLEKMQKDRYAADVARVEKDIAENDSYMKNKLSILDEERIRAEEQNRGEVLNTSLLDKKIRKAGIEIAVDTVEKQIVTNEHYASSKLGLLVKEEELADQKVKKGIVEKVKLEADVEVITTEKLILDEKLKTEQEKNGEMKYVHMYKWKYYDYDGNKVSVVPSKNSAWIVKRNAVIAKEIEVNTLSAGTDKDTAMKNLAILEGQLRDINKYNAEPTGNELKVSENITLQMYKDGKGDWTVYDSVASKKISIREMYLSYGDIDTAISARDNTSNEGDSWIITDIGGKVRIINKKANENSVADGGYDSGDIQSSGTLWDSWEELVTGNVYKDNKANNVFAKVKNICDGVVFANSMNINSKMIDVTTEISGSNVTGGTKNVQYNVTVDESEIYASRLSDDGDITGANQSVVMIEKQSMLEKMQRERYEANTAEVQTGIAKQKKLTEIANTQLVISNVDRAIKERDKAEMSVELSKAEKRVVANDGYVRDKLAIVSKERELLGSKVQASAVEKLILDEKYETEKEKNGAIGYEYAYMWYYIDVDGAKRSVTPTESENWTTANAILATLQTAYEANDTEANKKKVQKHREQINKMLRYNKAPTGDELQHTEDVYLQTYTDGSGTTQTHDGTVSTKVSTTVTHGSYEKGGVTNNTVDTTLVEKDNKWAINQVVWALMDKTGKWMVILSSNVADGGITEHAYIQHGIDTTAKDMIRPDTGNKMTQGAIRALQTAWVDGASGLDNILVFEKVHMTSGEKNKNNYDTVVDTVKGTTTTEKTYQVKVDESEVYEARQTDGKNATGANQSVVRIEKQAMLEKMQKDRYAADVARVEKAIVEDISYKKNKLSILSAEKTLADEKNRGEVHSTELLDEKVKIAKEEVQKAGINVEISEAEKKIVASTSYVEDKLKILGSEEELMANKVRISTVEKALMDKKVEASAVEKLILDEKYETEKEKNGTLTYNYVYKWKYYDVDGQKHLLDPLDSNDVVVSTNVVPEGSKVKSEEVAFQVYKDGTGQYKRTTSTSTTKVEIQMHHMSYTDSNNDIVQTRVEARSNVDIVGMAYVVTDKTGESYIHNETAGVADVRSGTMMATVQAMIADTSTWADKLTGWVSNGAAGAYADVVKFDKQVVYIDASNKHNYVGYVTTEESSTDISDDDYNTETMKYAVTVDETEVYSASKNTDSTGTAKDGSQSLVLLEKLELIAKTTRENKRVKLTSVPSTL